MQVCHAAHFLQNGNKGRKHQATTRFNMLQPGQKKMRHHMTHHHEILQIHQILQILEVSTGDPRLT